MSDAFNNKHNDALQLAFSRSLKNLEDASSGPVDPSILAILGDSVSADVPEELWSAEAMDKVDNAIRSGDTGLPPEVGPRVMRAAVSSMGTDFSILSRAAVPER